MSSSVAAHFQLREPAASIATILTRSAVLSQSATASVVMTMDDRMRKERLGFAIRAAMRSARPQPLSQEDLAAVLGKSVTTVGRWVRGQTAPSVLEVGPLAEALGVSPLLFIDPPAIPDYPLDEYRVRQATQRGTEEGLRRARKPRPRRPDAGTSEP